MIQMNSWLKIISLACCLILCSGCAALLIGGGAAVGAGSVAYVNGELRSVESVSLDAAWKAVENAMKQLELAEVAREKDALRAKMKARGAGDKKVVVKLKKVLEQSTELRVRVGLFGDKVLSQAILEAVRKRFPAAKSD